MGVPSTLPLSPSATCEHRAARGHAHAVASIIGVTLILFALGGFDDVLTLLFLVLGVPAATIFGHRACAQLPRGQMRMSWLMAYVGVAVGDTSAGLVLLLLLVLRPCGFVEAASGRELAHRINCKSNLKQLALACELYANDNDGVLPPDFGTLATSHYLDAYRTYTCPSSISAPGQTPADLIGPTHCDYRYFGTARKVREIGQHALLAADRDGNHDGYYNVVFVNGKLENYRGATWGEVVANYNLPVPPPARQLGKQQMTLEKP